MPGNTYHINPFQRVSAMNLWESLPAGSFEYVIDWTGAVFYPGGDDPRAEWTLRGVLSGADALSDAQLQGVMTGATSGATLDFSNIPVTSAQLDICCFDEPRSNYGSGQYPPGHQQPYCNGYQASGAPVGPNAVAVTDVYRIDRGGSSLELAYYTAAMSSIRTVPGYHEYQGAGGSQTCGPFIESAVQGSYYHWQSGFIGASGPLRVECPNQSQPDVTFRLYTSATAPLVGDGTIIRTYPGAQDINDDVPISELDLDGSGHTYLYLSCVAPVNRTFDNDHTLYRDQTLGANTLAMTSRNPLTPPNLVFPGFLPGELFTIQ